MIFSTCYHFRYACAIQDQQDVVITGGTFTYGRKVIKYLQIDGTSQKLPDLNSPYLLHACGHFLNSDGETVSLENILRNTYILGFLTLSP